MPSATRIPGIRTDRQKFQPRVIDGALAASDRVALMAAAGLFAGYESMTAEVGGEEGSPSIWDDVMDMTFACR